ncbi:MAG: hypothetical protein KDA86_14445 [Planctomycetaceae bacterium]|nr:hypothetical protein [Planctomycetaceae bacterium]
MQLKTTRQLILVLAVVWMAGLSAPTLTCAQSTETKTSSVPRVKTFLHSNGNKLGEGTLVDDVRDGVWTWWYDTGEEFASMTYDMGTPVGTERHLSRDGKILTTGEYKDGKEYDGTFVDFNGELAVLSMRTYKEGDPDGKWQWWHPNGAVNTEGAFEGGDKHGTWTWYYPNGQKFAESNFDHGTMVGRESHWNADGDVMTTGEYRDGSPWTGQFVDFLGADLVITFQRGFFDGEPHGDWIWRYDDGTLNTLGGFLNGNKDGRWEWWYANGEKFAETEYNNGVSKGKLSYYSDDGKLLAEGFYDENGSEVKGTFVDFTSELILTAERSWVDGQRDGTWKTWHENGQLASESKYNKGRQTGTWTTWNEEGVKTSEERFAAE